MKRLYDVIHSKRNQIPLRDSSYEIFISKATFPAAFIHSEKIHAKDAKAKEVTKTPWTSIIGTAVSVALSLIIPHASPVPIDFDNHRTQFVNGKLSYYIQRLGDLFDGIALFRKEVTKIATLELEIGGMVVCKYNADEIRSSKKEKVPNCPDKCLIRLFEKPIAIVMLQFHKVRLNIILKNPKLELSEIGIYYMLLGGQERADLLHTGLLQDEYYGLHNKFVTLVFQSGLCSFMRTKDDRTNEMINDSKLNILKLKLKSKTRKRQLKFCQDLIEHGYRWTLRPPNGALYVELKEKYAKKQK